MTARIIPITNAPARATGADQLPTAPVISPHRLAGITRDYAAINWAEPSAYLRPTRHRVVRPDYSDALFYLAAGALAALWVVAFAIGRMM